MKCRKIIPYLDAYVDGELPENLHPVVEAHLATCEVCQGRIEEVRGIDELFQDTLPVPTVPDWLAARITVEVRRRQTAAVSGRRSPSPAWNPLGWIAEFSVPMRLAACATVCLALVAGLYLDDRDVTVRTVFAEQGKDLYGLEWFAPVPPGSIGSIYIAMANQPYEKRSKQ